jgi:hypothetical protein
MTFEEICNLDPFVKSLYLEATAFRVILENGHPGRIWDAERAAKLKPDPNYCKTQLWKALPRERGEVGLKFLLDQCVGPGATVEALRTTEAQNLCFQKFLDDMPRCQHEPDNIITVGGMQIAESLCTYSYPLPPIDPEKQKKIDDGTCVMVNRLTDGEKTGFSSVIDQLRHAGGIGPEPEPLDVIPIDDLSEPIFIVKSKEDAVQLAINLEIALRWQGKKISTWYGRNAIMIADSEACQKIIRAKNLRRENFVGGLGWKPVVLTFSHPRFSAKLSSAGLAVTETDGLPESLDTFRNTVAVLQPDKGLVLPDMPESVLDGSLGKICRERMGDFPRAFAWPALLAVAGALVDDSPIRTNLYAGLIGDIGTGKTQAIKRAIWLLDLKLPILFEQKVGSGEGLGQRIGDVGNSARLWFPDELAHTMSKCQIQNATFAETLTTAWSQNQNDMTIAHQKFIPFSCRLSILGGLVAGRFGEAFGSNTTGGLWDRFIFSEYPTGFFYTYRPPTGAPVRQQIENDGEERSVLDGISLFEIAPDVWDERDHWVLKERINKRVCENALRVAAICAAWDGRATLRAADLGPALEFARYQEKMRGLHKPNPGKNDSGVIYHKLTDYLERHVAIEGENPWVTERDMVRATNVYDYGMPAVERTLEGMEKSGQVERTKQGRKRLIRKKV